METVKKYLKVVFLSIITFGVYGAYWIFVNMNLDGEGQQSGQEPDDTEVSARKAQNTIALTWLHFINR